MKIKILYTTFSNFDTAKAVCNKLVEEKLVACANIISNVFSIYSWNGAIEKHDEHIAILKTTKQRTIAAKKRLLELHEYENPAIIVIDAQVLNNDYFEWLLSCLITKSKKK